MAKIKFDSTSISLTEEDGKFAGVLVRDMDAQPETHADKTFDRIYDFFRPVKAVDLKDRLFFHGFSRSDIVLAQGLFGQRVEQAKDTVVKVNNQLSHSNPAQLSGYGDEIFLSFPRGEDRSFSVDCKLSSSLDGCKEIRISEFILTNPYWQDDLNPYYESNTYIFEADVPTKGKLLFQDDIHELFNQFSGLLR